MDYPRDWEVKKLGELCKIIRGASPRPIETYITHNANGVNWIKISDAPKYGKYITHTEEKITHSGAIHSVFVKVGDLILSNSMSFGRPYILKISGYIHDGWLRLYDYNNFDKDYLCYALSSKEVYKQYVTFAAGSGVQNLNKNVVKNVTIPFPHIAEQKAIADTLGTFDAHIKNLAELIEKKKAIRDGALEDLMSGRTRLKGFSENWERVSFNDVIIPKARIGWQGLKKHEYLQHGYSYLIGGTDFFNGTIDTENIWHVSKERYDMDKNIQVSESDVLVTKDGTIGKVAIVPNINKPATLNSGVFVFKTNDKLEQQFLYRVLTCSIFEKFINTLSAGSTIKHLYQKDLKNFSFTLPPLAEQKAIAETLTAFDNEIKALEAEREKIIQIRDGAMDDLLTGKIRLKF